MLSYMLLGGVMLGGSLVEGSGEDLKSGRYSVKQDWSQEKNFPREYHVVVPKSVLVPNSDEKRRFPVLIFLHGNGGNARGAMRGFLRRYPKISKTFVLVFPNGYRASWNIVSERSKADDRAFIEELIGRLSKYENVDGQSITLMGNSNGAALVNQIAIESRLKSLRNFITAVSPLNRYQHDGKHFKFKGSANLYDQVAKPATGRRFLNISGDNDRLIPYDGGRSPVIPAKGGKLAFVPAEESIFLWAKQMGYQGPKLTRPSRIVGRLRIFSYLDGKAIHYRVTGEGHGAARAVDEKYLLEFLQR